MPLPNERIFFTDDIYALPDGQRAELIDGKIYNMAPPSRNHQRIILELSIVISNYIKNRNGSCEVNVAPFAVFLNDDNKNYVEPDISIICDANKLDDKGCHGAPDWIIEIVSPGTQSRDYGIKLFKYRMSGVREYWIVNPERKMVNVYDFENDEATAVYSFDDTIPVTIYPNLSIKLSKLI